MEFLVELLLQIVAEFAREWVYRLIGAPFERKPHPVALVLGYGLFGAVAGGISTIVVPDAFINNPDWRLAYVCLSPLLIGAAMVQIRRDLVGSVVASGDGVYFCASAMLAFCFAGVRHLVIF